MAMRMDRSLIETALAGASTTRRLIVEPGALSSAGPVCAELYPGRPVVVVADEVTFAIAGETVTASLREAGQPVLEPVVFPGRPTLRPDTRHVATIRDRLAAAGEPVLPVAVGSGAISDLVKRAAHEAGVPYIAVATAPSMDGYLASGAALIHDGVKQTFPCAAPVAVIGDVDVLRAAPPAMIASGYGDLLGKVTAGADWIVADALGIEPSRPDVWSMVQDPLPALIAEPARYGTGDRDAIEQLFLGLAMTGLAIQVSGSTRCASGSEHQFSHLWEMRGLEHDGEPVSHGFKVGFGTLWSAALCERFLARDWSNVDVEAAVAAYPSLVEMEAGIRAQDDSPALIAKALEECHAKWVDAAMLRQRLAAFQDGWSRLRARLEAQMLPTTQVRQLLDEAGCPTAPEQLGLTLIELWASYAEARWIRRRYTLHDLAYELGVLHDLVAEVFAPGGFWAGELDINPDGKRTV